MIELFMNLRKKEIKGMTASVLCFTIASLGGAAAIYTALQLVFGIVNGIVTENNITYYWLILAGLIIIQTVGGLLGVA